jgi:dipeptidyl aminopeptidase/acylaminoacyl peptidase
LRVDLVTGTSVVIAADAHHDVLDVLLHSQTQEVQAVRFTGAQSQWRVIDRALRPDFDVLRRTAPGEISVVSRDEAGRIWTVQFDVDDRPPRYFVYDRETRMATPLFVPGPALEGQSFAPMRPIAFRARDGLELRGFLTLPVGNRAKGSPMVLLVHGGPWDFRDAWGFDPTVQWLANRGYTVLQVNFRGTWGDGKAHVNAGDGEFGGKMIDDLLDARSWAMEQGHAQTGRIGIMGASYGGMRRSPPWPGSQMRLRAA